MSKDPRIPRRAKVPIGPVDIDPLTRTEILNYCSSLLQSGGQAKIFYANAHAVNLAGRNLRFQKALGSASVVYCDGKAVQWAAQFLGYAIPERYTLPDWIDSLADLARMHERSVFFLGGRPEVAEGAADRIRRSYPSVQVESHHGYFDWTGDENEAVIRLINRFKPGLLFVGFGMPAQELWISENLRRLDVNLAFSVGGLFDFMSGHKRRGPRWMTDRGFEWLSRLLSEPRRLGGRYLLGNPQFLLTILLQKRANLIGGT